MIRDFRDFIARGNVLDLAVAVIIGAVFGNMDFSNKFILLGDLPADYAGPMTYAALKEAGVPMLGWGQFLTALVNFLILAFAIFLLVRAAPRASRNAEEAPEGPSEEVLLLREIRDSLKNRG